MCSGSFGSGAYVSLCTLPVMAFGEMEDVGRRVGMSLTILASGALAGPPISGAINAATGDFKAVGYYAGMAPSAPPGHAHMAHRHNLCRRYDSAGRDAYGPHPAATPQLEVMGEILRGGSFIMIFSSKHHIVSYHSIVHISLVQETDAYM